MSKKRTRKVNLRRQLALVDAAVNRYRPPSMRAYEPVAQVDNGRLIFVKQGYGLVLAEQVTAIQKLEHSTRLIATVHLMNVVRTGSGELGLSPSLRRDKTFREAYAEGKSFKLEDILELELSEEFATAWNARTKPATVRTVLADHALKRSQLKPVEGIEIGAGLYVELL